VFFGCRGLEIRRDSVELGVRCPSGAWGKPFASLLELALASIIRCIDEVQLVFGVCAFKQVAEPGSLVSCIAGEVEDDRHASRQE
jgi:hypothetical protein